MVLQDYYFVVKLNPKISYEMLNSFYINSFKQVLTKIVNFVN